MTPHRAGKMNRANPVIEAGALAYAKSHFPIVPLAGLIKSLLT
jgi:hypothetical protein